jgi:hypothetical protein
MDEHDQRVLGTLSERGRHRLGARRAAGHARDDLGRGELLGEQDRGLLPPRRSRDDDRVDQLAVLQPVDALREKRATAERGKRLRTIDPQPLTGAGCGDQGKDISA